MLLSCAGSAYAATSSLYHRLCDCTDPVVLSCLRACVMCIRLVVESVVRMARPICFCAVRGPSSAQRFSSRLVYDLSVVLLAIHRLCKKKLFLGCTGCFFAAVSSPRSLGDRGSDTICSKTAGSIHHVILMTRYDKRVEAVY